MRPAGIIHTPPEQMHTQVAIDTACAANCHAAGCGAIDMLNNKENHDPT